jgi:hypothetical protein
MKTRVINGIIYDEHGRSIGVTGAKGGPGDVGMPSPYTWKGSKFHPDEPCQRCGKYFEYNDKLTCSELIGFVHDDCDDPQLKGLLKAVPPQVVHLLEI